MGNTVYFSKDPRQEFRPVYIEEEGEQTQGTEIVDVCSLNLHKFELE